MKYEEREVSPDAALEWLNAWCGRRVHVVGRLHDVLIFEADGELRHAASVGDPGRVGLESYQGRYCVGSASTSFKLSDPALSGASYRVIDTGSSAEDTGEALHATLSDGALMIVGRLQD